MFLSQAKKTPPPIGTPRNGNGNGNLSVDNVGTLFGDLLISRPMAPPDMMNGDWMNPKKQNSTNSNSPISVASLDEIYESNDSKHPKTSFYSTMQSNFSDEKSSGASSLFSSGM
jgi:hypothetical protein